MRYIFVSDVDFDSNLEVETGSGVNRAAETPGKGGAAKRLLDLGASARDLNVGDPPINRVNVSDLYLRIC